MRRKFQPGNFKLRVRRTRTGLGLFAEEPIRRGSSIIEYIGKPATAKQIKEDGGKYLFLVGRGKTIDGNIKENTARYINHSCKPNCEADGPSGKVFILALRNVKAGEELTYDYGEEYFNEHIKPKGCRCVKCSSAAGGRRGA